MKFLTLILLFFVASPASAQAASGASCRFSKVASERNEAQADKCAVKLCSHVVICDGEASQVVCKARGGECDGYTADQCKKESASIVEDAQFVPTPFVAGSTEPVRPPGGGAPGGGVSGR